jgi:hypothetical protein
MRDRQREGSTKPPLRSHMHLFERTETHQRDERSNKSSARVALVREHAAESTGVGVCAMAPGETLPAGAACLRVDVRDRSSIER